MLAYTTYSVCQVIDVHEKKCSAKVIVTVLLIAMTVRCSEGSRTTEAVVAIFTAETTEIAETT